MQSSADRSELPIMGGIQAKHIRKLIGMLAKGFETWVGGLDEMPHETRLICDSEVADVLGFALVTLIEKTSGRESHKSSFIPLPLVPCPLQVAFFEYISSIRGRE